MVIKMMISFSGVTIGSKREEKYSKQKLEINAMSSISHSKQLTKKKMNKLIIVIEEKVMQLKL